jgi:ferredoxin
MVNFSLISMPKVSVNETECSGCGICYNDECPELFVEGDGGISELLPIFQKNGKHEGDVPADKKDCAKRAAMSCPNSAIMVE